MRLKNLDVLEERRDHDILDNDHGISPPLAGVAVNPAHHFSAAPSRSLSLFMRSKISFQELNAAGTRPSWGSR
jgi:hypothetical protein